MNSSEKEAVYTDQLLPLELSGITKKFPGIIANDSVDFTLREGEIHTILGENGAGKSTLMNMIAGLYPADAGEMRVFGKQVNFTNPRQAIDKSIGMVFQHFMLVRNHTVAENIILGLPGLVRLELEEVHQQIREISERYDLFVDPDFRRFADYFFGRSADPNFRKFVDSFLGKSVTHKWQLSISTASA